MIEPKHGGGRSYGNKKVTVTRSYSRMAPVDKWRLSHFLAPAHPLNGWLRKEMIWSKQVRGKVMPPPAFFPYDYYY